MKAQEKLQLKTNNGLHVCVGLDSDINKIPAHLINYENPILEFNKNVIDATAETAAAFKINFAFYENWGIKGIQTLKETINYIPDDILIIADAKRGDIGNTSRKYAESVFEFFKCDSVTLHPYMGFESVEPFLKYEDKISFILGLTSNSSAIDFEKQKLMSGKYLYQEVITKVNSWNINNNCGLVFGATNIDELQSNISLFNSMPILLPGIGAQGGSLEDVVSTFNNKNKLNFLINISRGLIYTDASKDFKISINKKIFHYNKIIHDLLI